MVQHTPLLHSEVDWIANERLSGFCPASFADRKVRRRAIPSLTSALIACRLPMSHVPCHVKVSFLCETSTYKDVSQSIITSSDRDPSSISVIKAPIRIKRIWTTSPLIYCVLQRVASRYVHYLYLLPTYVTKFRQHNPNLSLVHRHSGRS